MKKFLIVLFSLFLFVGCGSKEIVPKYVYIKQEYPTLKVYEISTTIEISASRVKIDGKDKVCVKEWDGCIKTEEFKRLQNYINEYKTNLKKCNNEIILFNDFADQNLTNK
jgi:hypothetical protein